MMSGFKFFILSATVFLLFDTFGQTTAQDKICPEEYYTKLNEARTKLITWKRRSVEIDAKLADIENRCCQAASTDDSLCTSSEREGMLELRSKYTKLISELEDVDGGLEAILMEIYCNDPPTEAPPPSGDCANVDAVQSDVDMLTEALTVTQSTLQVAIENNNKMMSLLKKTKEDLALVKGQCCKNECPEGSGKLNEDGTFTCVDGCKPICEFLVPDEELLLQMTRK